MKTQVTSKKTLSLSKSTFFLLNVFCLWIYVQATRWRDIYYMGVHTQVDVFSNMRIEEAIPSARIGHTF